MNRDEKAKVVDELRETFANAPAVVLASATGMTVNTVNQLRSELRKNGASFSVVKNTLAKRAIAGTDMEILAGAFAGPTAIAIHPEEPGKAAKVLIDFKKKNEALEIKAGYVDGTLLDNAGVEMLSKMPGKDELRAKIIGLLTAVPTKVVRVLTAAQRDVLGILAARQANIDT
jgi:large subunit ribosomal protein L10